jgi:protein-S-isoprenylcysteine O-methyltransferase Ste14
MMRLFAGLRAAVYATGFVTLFGWIALSLRPLDGRLGLVLPPATRLGGAALIGVGAALALWCIAVFVVRGLGTPAPFDAPRFLVAGGPYRWSRNPMYVGGLAVLAGLGLWLQSGAILLFAVVALGLAQAFVVLYEEPTLRRAFGESYEQYLRDVPRWVGCRRAGSADR